MGTVKVWLIELSPFVGLVPPMRAEYVPECAPPLTTAAVPTVVQPVKLPVSNPPLVMPPLEGAVTPRVTAVVCVAEAPAPVTVIVYVPAGVVADVANVSREDPPELIGFVANVAVVPAGMPLALSVIDCALPEVRTVEMVEVPELPAVTLTEVGLAEMEKSFAGTVSDTVVEWVAETPVPVTVMVYVPGAAVPAPTVSVELPPDWIGLVPKLQLAPVGHPFVERVIDCGLPEVTVVEMVLFPEAPWFTVRLFGLAEMEKSFGGGGPFTVSATVVECVFEVPAPVTVTV